MIRFFEMLEHVRRTQKIWWLDSGPEGTRILAKDALNIRY